MVVTGPTAVCRKFWMVVLGVEMKYRQEERRQMMTGKIRAAALAGEHARSPRWMGSALMGLWRVRAGARRPLPGAGVDWMPWAVAAGSSDAGTSPGSACPGKARA